MSQQQNLPDYKLRFLQEMEELRQQQARKIAEQNQQPFLNTTLQRNTKPLENNIINTAQYSSSDWRHQLNESSSKRNHDDSQYQLNLLINPEVKKKSHNIQLTPISEYSNAMHNKTVFVNPKSTSC